MWSNMAAAVLFVVILSVGEAIWSPRLYEYTVAIAPKGREGTYAGLSSAPYFVAKLGVGYIGGVLLEAYCPASPCAKGWMMWMIIGFTTIIGPIGIIVFYPYISAKDEPLSAVRTHLDIDDVDPDSHTEHDSLLLNDNNQQQQQQHPNK
eukprot:c12924_g1_i1.p2 GENE.c12924_g1_i1~~c12924_g1_i1.p2  ORF type:complete len:149 (+),score=42.66 c12924_g1_i1:194-640(+)